MCGAIAVAREKKHVTVAQERWHVSAWREGSKITRGSDCMNKKMGERRVLHLVVRNSDKQISNWITDLI